jgi:ring-1,2-phenylacetyl-CoA epoxidase subunit PaaB
MGLHKPRIFAKLRELPELRTQICAFLAAGDPLMSKDWPLWEVFVRAKGGMSHRHVGSVHAPDAEIALRHARDTYTRRMEGISLWVVPSAQIVASDPADDAQNFDPAEDKIYRHPTFYDIPDGITHI